jgi:hypothetical protein
MCIYFYVYFQVLEKDGYGYDDIIKTMMAISERFGFDYMDIISRENGFLSFAMHKKCSLYYLAINFYYYARSHTDFVYDEVCRPYLCEQYNCVSASGPYGGRFTIKYLHDTPETELIHDEICRQYLRAYSLTMDYKQFRN